MKMRNISLLLVAFIVGCWKEEPIRKDYDELRPTDVIVRVASHSFDRQTCDELVDVVLEREKKSRRASSRTEEQRQARRVALEKAFIDQFASSASICSIASENGYSPDLATCSGIMSNYARKASGGRLTVEAFAKKYPLAWRHTEKMTKMALTAKSYFETAFSNELVVTDADVKMMKDYVRRYNEDAARTNALIYACASNVCALAKGGSDFTKLVERYDRHPSRKPDGMWGELNLSDFDDMPDVLAAVSRSRPGDICGPIEGDDGLLVLKVVEHEGVGNVSVVNANPERFVFQRIYFELPVFFENPTDDYVRADLRKRKMTDVIRRETDKILKTNDVTFPFGKDLW